MNVLLGPSWKFYRITQNQAEQLHGEEFTVSFDFETENFTDLMRKLPAGWQPDLILYEAAEYNSMPLGIENAPCPTAIMVGDWNIGYTLTKHNLSRFDRIVVDRLGVQVFKDTGYNNIDYFSVYAHHPETHYVRDGSEKIYDVLFVGNFNHEIQRERAKWLKRLSLLYPKYNIALLANIFGERYPQLLNQAKIVFNRSIRSEMNQRAYEAPANGALLFFEEENLEIRDFLEPGKECILYNENNFEELIEYYVTHNEERQRIVEAGTEKIRQFTFERQLCRLVHLLEKRNIFAKEGKHRSFSKLSSSMQYYQNAKIALIDISSKRLEIAEENLQKAIALDHANFEARNALGFVYLLMMEQYGDNEEKSNFYFEKGMNTLIDITEEEPNAALVHYNLGFICQTIFRHDLAEEEYLKAFEIGASEEPLVVQDFFFPRDFKTFRIEWEKISATLSGDQEKQDRAHKKLLRWQCALTLGEMYRTTNQVNEALHWYNQAIAERPDISGKIHLKIAELLEILDRDEEAFQQVDTALTLEPFTPGAWAKKSEILFKMGKFRECYDYCRELFLLIKCAPFYEGELSWLVPFYRKVETKINEEVHE